MLITVYCVRRDLTEVTFSLEVDADFELQNFQALCELECGIPAAESQIIYAEVPLTDSHRSLASYGLKDGDVVILRQKENANAELTAPFSEKFIRVLLEQQQERSRREQERIRLFSADPFDLEAQAKIEEDIRQQNIEENMTIAMEEAPESFGQVVMLYINCKVNGYPVKAFVDSGAQMTIMSQACAERCHIMRLVDRRWAGIAKGVGTQKIIGRVHLAQVQIEGDFLPCSFSILEEQPMDMLLGLDMLKRHQCSIDLKKNVLMIGTTGTKTTFLPEGELPECAKLAYGPGREDMQPEDIADQELAEVLQKSAQEAGSRDKETTSLEMPSQTTTGGLNRSAAPSGLGFEICNPPGHLLDRSVSAPASVCPQKSSLSENIEPVGSLSPTECLASREKEKQKLPLQDPSEHTSVDDASFVQTGTATFCSPIIASQSISEEPISVEDAHNCEPRTSGTQVSSSVAAASMPTVVLGEEHSSCEHVELNPVDNLSLGLQLPQEPLHKQPVQQFESTERKHPGTPGGLEFYDEENHDSQESFVNLLNDSTQVNVKKIDLSPLEKCTPPLATFSKDTEMIMDIDRNEDPLTALLDLAVEQNPKNNCVVAVNPDCSEMEILETDISLSEVMSQEISTDCLIQSENNITMTEASRLPSENHHSLFSTSSDILPLTQDPVEEPGLSLAAALKELHKLLIVSCSGASTTVSEEDLSLPNRDLDDQSKSLQFTKENVKNALLNVDPNILNSKASLLEEVSEPECSHDRLRHDDTEELGHSQPSVAEGTCKMSGLEYQYSATVSHLTESSAHQNLLPDSNKSSTSDPCPLEQVSEQNEVSASEITLNKNFLPQGVQNAETQSTETVDSAFQLVTLRPVLEEPQDLAVNQPGLSLEVPSSIFPVTAIHRILNAGFSLQEALGALQEADGNVDLALLALLAKNIVVPT
uniref:Protein DDI1 homolog 2 n=1 Tax=Geotrypetes seraphini TaxID=260995 RepID=A0A6P8P9A7_GEOSA|nr:protein DDI1 homolog 2 isoform X2 [Geotrypetes seraphini]